MVLCQVCGRPNSDDARFCFSCGTTISQGPPVKVEVKSPLGSVQGVTTSPTMSTAPASYPPRHVPRQGSCYYHAELPATYICSRCGRSICVACNRQYGVLSFCTECFYGLVPKIGYGPSQYTGAYQYPAVYPQQEQARWPF